MTLLKKIRAYIAHFGKRSMTQTRGSKITQLTDTFPRNEEENYDMTKKMCSNFSKSVIMNLDLPSLSIIFLTDQLSSKQQTAVKTLHCRLCPNATLSQPCQLPLLALLFVRPPNQVHNRPTLWRKGFSFFIFQTTFEIPVFKSRPIFYLEEWAIEDRLTPLFPS